MCCVQTLHLAMNEISDTGLSSFAEAVSKGALTCISFIDLDNNEATMAGKKAVSYTHLTLPTTPYV